METSDPAEMGFLAIGNDGEFVIIRSLTRIRAIGLTPGEAEKLALTLLKHAAEVRGLSTPTAQA